ncbi:hypothetical protein AB4520_16085 [Vibrio renipiscarius]|uniref:hypothetical protein n=1 Tax=Vibrio renipiscarius TaxID=1461322 RepID=UPI0035524303
MLVDVKCLNCSSDLSYEPGTTTLICAHCEHEMEIEHASVKRAANEELDLDAYLENFSECHEQIEALTVQCDSCGAATEFGSEVKATHCAFCDTPLVLSRMENHKRVKPQGIIPFQIKRDEAIRHFGVWVKKLSLAPNDLKKHAGKAERFQGIYIPYWTYDCDTVTDYLGQKGTNYQESVTVTKADGSTETKSEHKTRWVYVSGSVAQNFDDVLIPATRSVEKELLHKLEPWNLARIVDYNDHYLQGYQAETYQVNIKEGYVDAKIRMQERIKETIEREIGGDKQIISESQSVYSNATFKHLILPIWVSSYRYKNKVYQVLVNAQTGEVNGEYPKSPFKVAFAALMVLGMAAAIVYCYEQIGQ